MGAVLSTARLLAKRAKRLPWKIYKAFPSFSPGSLLFCSLVYTVARMFGLRQGLAFGCGIVAWPAYGFLPSASEVISDGHLDPILPSHMKTAEWHKAVSTVRILAEKLHAEVNPSENFNKFLPLHLGILWTYYNYVSPQTPPLPANPSTKEKRVPPESYRYCVFATTAYGAVFMTALGMLSPQKAKSHLESRLRNDAKTSLSHTIQKRTHLPEDAIVFVAEEVGQETNMEEEEEIEVCVIDSNPEIPTLDLELEMDDRDSGRPFGLCPLHFVAIDDQTKSVVLSIRGTATVADALTDLLCDRRGILGGYAHDGIVRSAFAVLSSAEDAIIESLSKNPGYRLVITGHSLGAGVSIMASLLLLKARIHGSFPGVPTLPKESEIHTFAFSPPPLFTPLWALSDAMTEHMHVFIHGEDCVPRLSFDSVSRALVRLQAIGDLKLDTLTAVRCITNPNSEASRRVFASVREIISNPNPNANEPHEPQQRRPTHTPPISTRNISRRVRRKRWSVLDLFTPKRSKGPKPIEQHSLQIPGKIYYLYESMDSERANDKGMAQPKPNGGKEVFSSADENELQIHQEQEDVKAGVDDEKKNQRIFKAREVNAAELEDFVVSLKAVTDHLPPQYEHAIQAVVTRQHPGSRL
ncbi:hypothetical protein AAMO2058_000923000 [Amorphochlora amoebiformis]